MTKLISTLPVFLCLQLTLAQHTEPGAEAAAMGGSFISINHPMAIYHNVAGAAGLAESSIFYWAGARSNYWVSGLNDYYIGSLFSGKNHAWGIDIAFFGIETYQRLDFSLSYATQINQNWSLGARLTYATDRITEENINRHLVRGQLGILGKLGNWRVAAASHGFLQSGWMSRVNEHEPVILRLGGGYVFGSNAVLSAEVYKAEFDDPDFRLGMSFIPEQNLKLMFGFSTSRPAVSMGIGLVYKNLTINLAAAWHQQLGLSPLTDVLVQH